MNNYRLSQCLIYKQEVKTDTFFSYRYLSRQIVGQWYTNESTIKQKKKTQLELHIPRDVVG